MTPLTTLITRGRAALVDLGETIWNAGVAFDEDDCADLSAALAFYSVFSMAPLVVVLTRVVGVVLPDSDALLVSRVGRLVGEAGADQVAVILSSFKDASQETGAWASVLSFLVSAVAATTVLAQLQRALNHVWNVRRGGSPLISLLVRRLASLALLALLAFVLFASVVVTSALRFFTHSTVARLPEVFSDPLVHLGDLVLSWLLFSLLFALLFRGIGDARIAMRSLMAGSAITGLLFVAGKLAISLYLGSSLLTSLYGAAASLAIVLTWVYYSAAIQLFGAELTKELARRWGEPIRPAEGATWLDPPLDGLGGLGGLSGEASEAPEQ